MTPRFDVKRTTRVDGNGKPVLGYYVTDYGVPVGPPHKDTMTAEQTLIMYIRASIRYSAQDWSSDWRITQ